MIKKKTTKKKKKKKPILKLLSVIILHQAMKLMPQGVTLQMMLKC